MKLLCCVQSVGVRYSIVLYSSIIHVCQVSSGLECWMFNQILYDVSAGTAENMCLIFARSLHRLYILLADLASSCR